MLQCVVAVSFKKKLDKHAHLKRFFSRYYHGVNRDLSSAHGLFTEAYPFYILVLLFFTF